MFCNTFIFFVHHFDNEKPQELQRTTSYATCAIDASRNNLPGLAASTQSFSCEKKKKRNTERSCVFLVIYLVSTVCCACCVAYCICVCPSVVFYVCVYHCFTRSIQYHSCGVLGSQTLLSFWTRSWRIDCRSPPCRRPLALSTKHGVPEALSALPYNTCCWYPPTLRNTLPETISKRAVH